MIMDVLWDDVEQLTEQEFFEFWNAFASRNSNHLPIVGYTSTLLVPLNKVPFLEVLVRIDADHFNLNDRYMINVIKADPDSIEHVKIDCKQYSTYHSFTELKDALLKIINDHYHLTKYHVETLINGQVDLLVKYFGDKVAQLNKRVDDITDANNDIMQALCLLGGAANIYQKYQFKTIAQLLNHMISECAAVDVLRLIEPDDVKQYLTSGDVDDECL